MSANREIITLQLGNYSNFIGAHLWNIQESTFNYDPSAETPEIDHDVFYREGKNAQHNVTYTPRLLLVDLKGSLGHLSETGGLYEDLASGAPSTEGNENCWAPIKQSIHWDPSKIEVIEQKRIEKPEFQKDLDDGKEDITSKDYKFSEKTTSWSDYLYARYHPRSFHIINDYEHSLEKDAFESFSAGRRLWETSQFQDDFCDNIRQYVEECHNSQGFQLIFDCVNAFSGLTNKCLEHLNDEYSKATFAIPVFSPKPVLFDKTDEVMTDTIRVANIALTYSNLVENASIFLPLSTLDRAWRQLGSSRKFPSIKYSGDNLYETSAILASYLDTISLRYRIRNPTYSSNLSGFCMDLTNYGRKLTAAAFSYPLSMRYDHDLIDCLDQFEGSLFTQLSPNSAIGRDYVVQSVCVRGVPKNRLKRPLQLAQKQMKMAAYKCNSISEMFQLYFQCENHCSLAHVSSVETPLQIHTPYPSQIFDPRLNSDGFISDVDRSCEKLKSIPTIASVQNSGDLSNTLEGLHRDASRISIAKLHRFRDSGLEADEFSEALENLLQFKDRYEDNYDL